MKRFVRWFTICLSVILCAGCQMNNVTDSYATDFSQNPVENGFNNSFVNSYGCDMALVNNSIYFQAKTDAVYNGVLKRNSEAVERITKNSGASVLDEWVCFYNFNNVLYEKVMKNLECFWYRYNDETQKFVKVNNTLPISEIAYPELKFEDNSPDENSDTIKLETLKYVGDYFYITSEDSQNIYIHYYNNPNYSSELNHKNKNFKIKVDNYYVFGDLLYYLKNGDLYIEDLSKGKGYETCCAHLDCDDSELLVYFNENIYYTTYENGVKKLYSYSILTKEKNCLSETAFICCNYLNGDSNANLYVSFADGVYVLNGSKLTKVSDFSAESIFIFDSEWIYLNDNKGTIIRINHNGEKSEKIADPMLNYMVK